MLRPRKRSLSPKKQRGSPGLMTMMMTTMTTAKSFSSSSCSSNSCPAATATCSLCGESSRSSCNHADEDETGNDNRCCSAAAVRDEASRPGTVSFPVPIVEEAPPVSNMEKEWLSVVGRIELLLLEDQTEEGAIVNRRLQIVCLPSDSDHVVTAFRDQMNEEDDHILLDGSSGPDDSASPPLSSMLESLTTGLMDTCTSTCATSVLPKSALRRKPKGDGDDHNPAIHRAVSFDKVNLHEFNITLGDHPNAASGPPVAINWEQKPRISSVSLDEYEQRRLPLRRHRKQLKMSMKTRCGILQKEAHFSAQEISDAWEQSLRVRKQRKETLQGGIWRMVYDDFWESANRKLNRVSNSISGLVVL